MSRHSKNNTSGSVFTYHERKRLKYGTISERLGGESQKEYDSCSLCLHTLKEPMAWYVLLLYIVLREMKQLTCGNYSKKGHVFCKECIYEYLLAQKKELARQTDLYEQQEKRLQVSIAYTLIKQ